LSTAEASTTIYMELILPPVPRRFHAGPTVLRDAVCWSFVCHGAEIARSHLEWKKNASSCIADITLVRRLFPALLTVRGQYRLEMSTCLMALPSALCPLDHALAHIRSDTYWSMAFVERLIEELVVSEVTPHRLGRCLQLLVVVTPLSPLMLVVAGYVCDHPRLCAPPHMPPSPGAHIDRLPTLTLTALPWSRLCLPLSRAWPLCLPPNPARCPHSRRSIPQTIATTVEGTAGISSDAGPA
jgi:hypothetical protein